MRIRIELAAPFGHDVPPSRCLNRHADPQEGQNGFDQNGFGTNIGACTLYGGRVSITLGISVALLAVFFGTVAGLLSGYFRWVDA